MLLCDPAERGSQRPVPQLAGGMRCALLLRGAGHTGSSGAWLLPRAETAEPDRGTPNPTARQTAAGECRHLPRARARLLGGAGSSALAPGVRGCAPQGHRELAACWASTAEQTGPPKGSCAQALRLPWSPCRHKGRRADSGSLEPQAHPRGCAHTARSVRAAMPCGTRSRQRRQEALQAAQLTSKPLTTLIEETRATFSSHGGCLWSEREVSCLG